MGTDLDLKNRMPLILLTGCINPMGMTFTKLQNPDIRRKQYIDAIHFYLKVTDNPIVFVENSGNDISKEFAKEDKLEILTFSGNDYEKSLGKGYGEISILKYAFENSRLIRLNSSVCKITGRYKVLNIKSILKSYSKADCNLMVDLPKRMRYADSRIFIADKLFFEIFLLKNIALINDSKGFYFEHALNKSVFYAIMDGLSYLPLKYRPQIIGQSGTDGLAYHYSFFDWFSHNLRKMLNFKLFSEGLKYP